MVATLASMPNRWFDRSAKLRCLVPVALRAPAPDQPGRVCRAWHVTMEVQVRQPGIRRAEG